jgi:hypothetical protein
MHITPEIYTRNTLKQDTPNLDWRAFIDDAHFPPIPEDPYKKNYGFDEHVGLDDLNQGEFFKWLKEVKPELADATETIPFPDVSRGKEIFISPYPSPYPCGLNIINSATPWSLQPESLFLSIFSSVIIMRLPCSNTSVFLPGVAYT